MWAARFRFLEYLKGNVWVWALVCAILGPFAALLTRRADLAVTLPPEWSYSSSTATSVLSAVVGATVALAGFVVTVTVLAIQMATDTFSARYMRIWYRDHLLKATLAVLAGTFTFSFALLGQVDSDRVPDIGIDVAGVLLGLSLVLFLLFFGRFVVRLRPVAVAALVGKRAQREIRSLYRAIETTSTPYTQPSAAVSLTVPSVRAGAVQAIDLDGLIGWARSHAAVVVLSAGVGDFVIPGQTVLAVHSTLPPPDRSARRLLGHVAFGDERTIEQDPAFGVRIIVDVAVKALSAAINDPTTAVQALDHLSIPLRLLGSYPLASPLSFVDGDGGQRVAVPARTWEDYLALGVTEIREYGAGSIQVVRRLRALLDDLSASVRPEHRAAVDAERSALDVAVAAAFGATPDLATARAPDPQGIGGPRAVATGSGGISRGVV